MEVTRKGDLGPLESYAPAEPCGCYFAKVATGTTSPTATKPTHKSGLAHTRAKPRRRPAAGAALGLPPSRETDTDMHAEPSRLRKNALRAFSLWDST